MFARLYLRIPDTSVASNESIFNVFKRLASFLTSQQNFVGFDYYLVRAKFFINHNLQGFLKNGTYTNADVVCISDILSRKHKKYIQKLQRLINV